MADQRSPNYPRTSLLSALDDARILYNNEETAAFADTVAATHLGYTKMHGKVRLRLAAMRQYGLLDQDKSSGSFRLSQRALTLLLRPADHPERQAAIRDAALQPKLFREFHEQQPTSSDSSLIYELITKRGFTNSGAKVFVASYRGTIQMLTESQEMTLTNGAIRDTVHVQEVEPSGPEAPTDDPERGDFHVGDYVRVLINGQEIYKDPVQIKKIDISPDGEPFALFDPSVSLAGARFSELTKCLPPADGPHQAGPSPTVMPVSPSQGDQPMPQQQYPIPLGSGAYAVLILPNPITEEMYKNLEDIIQKFKPLLTSPAALPSSPNPQA